MLQKGSKILIVDNSGAKDAVCIHVYGGYKRRYAYLGNKILVTVKKKKRIKLKGSKRKQTTKPKQNVKKGMVLKAVLLETKKGIVKYSDDILNFKRNTGVLLSDKQKFFGTRIFTPVPTLFRRTGFARLMFMARGRIR
jgi:large subunit ribosomal protein L14